ncbi:MAG: hypothetical protein WBG92_09180, partial [Thiohalocapsa sp.]
MLNALERIRLQGARFVRTFHWLLNDSIRSTPHLWRRILVASAISLASNMAVVGIIYIYISLVERGQPISLLGVTAVPSESFSLLALVVSGLIGVSLVFAASQYYARSNAIKAMGAFEKRCTIRTLNLYRLLPNPRAKEADRILKKKKLLHLAKTDATYCGMAVKFLGFGVQALLMLVFALAVMFILDAPTTFLVSGLGLLIIASQYPSTLFAATATAIHTRTRPEMQSRLLALLDYIARQPRHSEDQRLSTKIAGFFDIRAIHLHIEAAENRFRAIEISGLTTRIGSAVILGGMVLVFGTSVLKGEV